MFIYFVFGLAVVAVVLASVVSAFLFLAQRRLGQKLARLEEKQARDIDHMAIMLDGLSSVARRIEARVASVEGTVPKESSRNVEGV